MFSVLLNGNENAVTLFSLHGCLNNVPFLSCSLILLVANPLAITSWFKRWTFCVLSNATVSVDSFFVLSGLLTTYLFLKELDRKKSGPVQFLITVPVMYLHRYIRCV